MEFCIFQNLRNFFILVIKPVILIFFFLIYELIFCCFLKDTFKNLLSVLYDPALFFFYRSKNVPANVTVPLWVILYFSDSFSRTLPSLQYILVKICYCNYNSYFRLIQSIGFRFTDHVSQACSICCTLCPDLIVYLRSWPFHAGYKILLMIYILPFLQKIETWFPVQEVKFW